MRHVATSLVIFRNRFHHSCCCCFDVSSRLVGGWDVGMADGMEELVCDCIVLISSCMQHGLPNESIRARVAWEERNRCDKDGV